MDKVIKAAQFLALILISLASVAYMWRQYYDYKSRDDAWKYCSDWGNRAAKGSYDAETLMTQECVQRIKP